MKFLFTITPQWYPISPYLSSAILAGQLKAHGFDADTFDFNADFFNYILTSDYILSSIEKAKHILSSENSLTEEYSDNNISENTRQKLIISEIERVNIIKEFFKDGAEKAAEIAAATDDAVKVFKNSDLFFNPEMLFKAKDIVAQALEIVSLPYAPSKIMLDNYIANPLMTFNYEDVKIQCYNSSMNLYVQYFTDKLEKMNFSEYICIGISITDLSQLIPGLTLARLLKRITNAKICLGGNYIFKIEQDIKKYPEIFELFCDYLMIGDGEEAVVELAEYLSGIRNIRDVHSLVYKDESGHILTNSYAHRLKMDQIAYPDFDGYCFEKYLSPRIVLPVQLGKGCYWGKCTFCDFYTGQQKYDIKSVKRAADEVEFLSKKYECNHFTFVDEAIPPKYYNELALEFIKRGLKINYYSFARLETGFTSEILQNLYKSGGRFLMWGYEAESERIMSLINKGIDSKKRISILENAHNAGLWNHCTFLLCYPSETPEELKSTIDIIYKRDLVNSCTPSNFALKKNSILINDTKSVGITNFMENSAFHISYKYEAVDKSMADVKKARNNFEIKFKKDTAESLWSLTFTDSDHLLLYLSQYGRDWVLNYKLKYVKQT